MRERDKPLIIALRLKVVNGQITEIEHVLARGLRADALNLAVPRSEFSAMLPAASRLPRQQMVNIAASYFEAIEHANGKLAPFADNCMRRENGARPRTMQRRCLAGAAGFQAGRRCHGLYRHPQLH